MRALMVVMIFMFMTGWLMSIYDVENVTKRSSAVRNTGAAINFVQFREAAMRYGFFYKDQPDADIPNQRMRDFLPDDWTQYPGTRWHARVSNGYVYSWGEASPEIIEQARKMTGFSPSVGENQNGRLRPGDIALPGFIPNRNLVSVTGSGRYRPDNENY